MYNLTKLTLSSILITIIVLGLSSPVAAQPPAPTIYVDAPPFVSVSTEFDIIIWIRDIQSGYGMVQVGIRVQWDPNDLEYIDCEFLGEDRLGTWGGGCGPDVDVPGLAGGGGGGDAWTADAEWLRFRFHCLREGPAPITVSAPADGTIVLEPVAGGTGVVVEPEPVTVTIDQRSGAVGGVASPVNKLEIMTPYIALAGLIAAVSAVYVIKKRKD